MFWSYIIIAFRNLLKNKVFSIINIMGLSIGMTACFLILQYVSFELSFDKFHKHASDTYRVYLDIYKEGKRETQSARVSPAVATAFQEEFSNVEAFTRMVILGPDGVLTHEDRYTGEADILLADSAFFDIFSFHLLSGDSRTALSEPFCVVITESIARSLFDGEVPVGKTVVINADNFDGTSLPFKVTGVIQDFPENSHLQPGVLISYPTLFEFVGHRFDDSWQWNETYTYVRLHPNTDPQKLEDLFPEVVHRFNPQLNEQQLDWRYRLQSIADIHLHSELRHEASVNGNAFYVYFLAGVGMLILIIAYINFVNLVTVKALRRAKEVGIRKVSGAYRSQLITQFFLEALLVNALALAASIALLQITTSYFADWFNVILDYHQVKLWLVFGPFLILLVLGSGFYPAFVLSHYKPTSVLKGEISKGSSGIVLRQSLVVSQFAIALVLIALTLTAILQIRYMQQQSLGFNPEQIVIIKSPKSFDYGYGNNFFAFQNKATQLIDVKSISGSSVIPGQEIYWYDDQVKIDGQEASGVFSLQAVAQNYFLHYDIPLISGRHFTGPSREKWIVNEAALALLGFKDADDAVGAKLNTELNIGEIIGVVKNFHHESLKSAIPPMMFFCGGSFNYYAVKIGTRDISNTLISIETAYRELFPGSPYEYFFLDEFFDRQYKTEQQFNDLFSLFSGLAIFIACLGLLGLSSYVASQRTKEIGIRKVMGASVLNVAVMLAKDFIKLVLFAGVLASPVAYMLIDRWLENYAVRIEITWWLLAAPLGFITMLAFLTISLQTVKAALANPVTSLRYE